MFIFFIRQKPNFITPCFSFTCCWIVVENFLKLDKKYNLFTASVPTTTAAPVTTVPPEEPRHFDAASFFGKFSKKLFYQLKASEPKWVNSILDMILVT